MLCVKRMVVSGGDEEGIHGMGMCVEGKGSQESVRSKPWLATSFMAVSMLLDSLYVCLLI